MLHPTSVVQDIDELLRSGDIEKAASLARARGMTRRAAELLSLGGRHAEAVLLAVNAREWRVAMDVALAAGDEQVLTALCAELSRESAEVAQAAAQARVAHRLDVAARVLEVTDPIAAGQSWYEIGEYARAGQCFDRANDAAQAIRAFEQQLAQNPDDASVAERLAELRASRGDVDGAVRALQTAVHAGAGASAWRKLVDGLARIGLEGSARAALERWRTRAKDAPRDITDCAGALPNADAGAKRYAGRYRVIREVGSGASGRVLEALDELSGEPVALKILAVSDDRGGAFGRFMREAELARSLDDPTIVRMRALDPEGPTIVYDWMPRGTLADRIATLTLPEVKVIAMRLLSALETLHRNGVVHRDLKPSNVLFDAAGQARLGDLGAAHLGDLGATVTGGLVGSLPYMAPEQITGGSVSAATDLYAFGCVLFQMLTGRTPFAGPDYVSQHLGDAPPKVSDVRAALGTEYDAALEALLAKDPLARTQQAGDARKAIANFAWTDPIDEPRAMPSRASLPPAGASGDEGARWIATDEPGRFRDARVGRLAEGVRVDAAQRERVMRWAASNASALQPVYDVQPDGDDLVAYVEPLRGDRTSLARLPTRERDAIERALRVAGADLLIAPSLEIVRSPAFGAVVPISALAGGTSRG